MGRENIAPRKDLFVSCLKWNQGNLLALGNS